MQKRKREKQGILVTLYGSAIIKHGAGEILKYYRIRKMQLFHVITDVSIYAVSIGGYQIVY